MARCSGVRLGKCRGIASANARTHCSYEGLLHSSAVERLWTPWRRAYLEGGDSHAAGCFLCAHAADAEHDRENLIAASRRARLRAAEPVPVQQRSPDGRAVRAHRRPARAAGFDRVGTDAGDAARRGGAAVGVSRPTAFNVGMNLGKSAGAGVPDHLHVHVVPRWDGDTNFMPVVGETKVLPETPGADVRAAGSGLLTFTIQHRAMTDWNTGAFSLQPHARRVDKPWGYEILLSPAERRLHVQADPRPGGQALEPAVTRHQGRDADARRRARHAGARRRRRRATRHRDAARRGLPRGGRPAASPVRARQMPTPRSSKPRRPRQASPCGSRTTTRGQTRPRRCARPSARAALAAVARPCPA